MAARFLNPFPKYLQLREALRRRLERSFPVGGQFPSEHALRQEYGVSRETVRDALRGLEEEGLIRRVRGQGTFVAKIPTPRSERRLTGLTEDFSALKLDTEARVLERGLVLPPPTVAEIMKTQPDQMVYRIARLRFFSRNHFAHHDAFLPSEIGSQLARLDLRRTSIVHELKETLGLAFWEDHQRIEATLADPELGSLLRVHPGEPLLRITRLFLTAGDKPIVLFRSHFRADRYFYTVKMADHPRAASQPKHQKERLTEKASRREPGVPAA